ncbi:CRTAC1 family protein [bacterium]|nr:CRTAC1 family protein [candidate division CSSED10-310 bacterium]
MGRMNGLFSAAGLAVLVVMALAAAPAAPAATAPLVPTPYFTDVSAETALDTVHAFRIGIVDLNNDLYPDLVLHLTPDEGSGDVVDKQLVYLNVPGDDPGDPHDRRFEDFTEASGIRDNRAGTEDGRHSSSALFGDIDNDGDVDMFNNVYLHRNYTLNLGTNDLMLNNGAGHFTFSGASTFHEEPIYNTPTAVFLDFNNDSYLDLCIGNWYFNDVMSQDYLYQGHGDGSFTNVTATCGIEGALTAVYAVATMDWNDDGLMDLFQPSYSHTAVGAQYYHWRNNGDGTFTNVTVETNYGEIGGYGSGFASFGSMPFDYDNDGDMDFFELLVHGNRKVYSTVVTNIDNVWLWDFERITGRDDVDPMPRHHGDHHAHFFDIENDGLNDYILSESGYDNNRLYIFKQEPDHTFHPVTIDTGLDVINDANLPPGNVSPLDYDLDGDDDLLVGFGNDAPLQLWRNDVGTLNNWLTLILEGAGKPGYSNRSAIGARITIAAGAAQYTREVHSGNGHQVPQIPFTQRFGLGQAGSVDMIHVRWPNTDLTELSMFDVDVNQFLTIREDPTNDPPATGVTLVMPQERFAPGDTCWLDAYLYNEGPDPLDDMFLIIVLDVYGTYFFYDDWSQDVDAVLADVPAGVNYRHILPSFQWPDTGEDEVPGLLFLGAMLDHTGSLVGGMNGLGMCEFSYGP